MFELSVCRPRILSLLSETSACDRMLTHIMLNCVFADMNLEVLGKVGVCYVCNYWHQWSMTSASHAEGRQFDPGLVYFHWYSQSLNSKRQGGGIEPLHVSMPRELKSRPSTSPTHPGRMGDSSSPDGNMFWL